MDFATFRGAGIFVGGQPRSGTTFLTALLDGAQGVVTLPYEVNYTGCAFDGERLDLRQILGEKIYNNLASQESRIAGWGAAGVENFGEYERLCGEVWSQVKDSAAPVAIKQFYCLVEAYRLVAGLPECRQWIVKCPKFEQMWGQVSGDFPDARLIYIYRDPRDVIRSRAQKVLHKAGREMPITPGDLWRFVREYSESVNAFNSIPSEEVCEVGYEQLRDDPVSEMSRLCDCLGLEFDPQMTKPSFGKKEWGTNSLNDGQSPLSQADKAYIEVSLKREFAQFGYAPEMSFLQGRLYCGLAAIGWGGRLCRSAFRRLFGS